MSKFAANELPEPKRRRLFELLEAVLQDDATEDEFATIRQMLTQHEAARTLAVRYLHIDALIARFESQFDSAEAETIAKPAGLVAAERSENLSAAAKADETINSSSSLPSNLSSLVVRRLVFSFPGRAIAALNRPIFWSIVAVAAVFYGTFALLSWNLWSGSLPEEKGSHDIAVAMIGNVTDVHWSADSPRTTDRATVQKGEPLRIDSGLVELQLTKGARLIIEGPAEWIIDGENNATLRSGKLVAHVPPSAVGFSVETSVATLVDLGTEFGVEMTSEGNLTLEVFQGAVQVSPSLKAGMIPGTVADRIILRAEQEPYLFIDAASGKVSVGQEAAFSTVFPRLKQQSRPQSALPTEQASVSLLHTLKADRPLAVWDFGQARNDIVWNAIADRYHGKLLGKPSAPGKFDGVDDFAEFQNLLADNFTIEVWFKTEEDREVQSEPSLVSINHLSDCDLRIHRGHILYAESTKNGPWSLAHGKTKVDDDRWHHVALCRQRHPRQEISLYVDGTLEDRKVRFTVPTPRAFGQDEPRLPPDLGAQDRRPRPSPHLFVGGIGELPARRYFQGVIEAVAIYDRALDEQTVQAHRAASLKQLSSDEKENGN